jgi:hypothetical protein
MNLRRLSLCLAATAFIVSPVILLLISDSDRSGAGRPVNFFRAERARPKVGEAGDETAEALTAAEQFAQARTAPGLVLPGAYSAAFASLSALPVVGRTWAEVTKSSVRFG